jgi:hypothetical protein
MRTFTSILFLSLATLVSGCSHDSSSGASAGTSAADERFGDHADTTRWVPVTLNLLIQNDLENMTIPQVKKALRYPHAVKVIGHPKFRADYDKSRAVTEVSVYGNGISASPYSGEVTQGYWAEWEIRGKIGPDSHPAPTDWQLGGPLEMFDQKFPDAQD